MSNDISERSSFEWDETKNKTNQRKHGILFEEAQYAFLDPKRVVAKDLEHRRVTQK